MYSSFGAFFQTHLLQASWQVKKPSICMPLVCVHIKVFKQAEVLSLVYLDLLFCSAFCFLTSFKAKLIAGGVGPKHNEDHFTFRGHFLSLVGRLGEFTLKAESFSLVFLLFLIFFHFSLHWHPLWCIVWSKTCESLGQGCGGFWCKQSNPQQEIYPVANFFLGLSNWLRRNLNGFLKLLLKSMVTVFYFQPRADWNWDNKWELSHSKRMRVGSFAQALLLGGGGGTTTKDWSPLLQRGVGEMK